MDPVSQIFLQAQAPTGKSNTGFEAFVQGRQLAQRDRQLNMQQREQDALLQLRAEAEALQNQSTGLDIELKKLAKQREIDVKMGQAELMQLMLGAKNTPEGILGTAPGAMAIASKYGASVFATPLGQAWFNNYRGVGVMQSGMERLKQQAAQAGLPAGKMTLDEKTGLPVTTFERPDTGPTPRIVQLQNERSRLQALGTEPQRLVEIDKAILNEQTETGEVIETLPGGGFRIVRGKGAAWTGPTVATQTQAAARITDAENALLSLGKSREALAANPRATGPVGAAIAAYEKLRAWVNPTASPSQFPITGARNQLQMTETDLIPMLKVDSQMSNYERQKLERLTEHTDFWSDTPAAKGAFIRLQDALIARALREMRDNTPGRKPSDSLLRGIRDEKEVEDLNKDRLLSKEDALRWYDLRKQETTR